MVYKFYRDCPICTTTVKDISTHLRQKHGLSPQERHKYLRDAHVILSSPKAGRVVVKRNVDTVYTPREPQANRGSSKNIDSVLDKFESRPNHTFVKDHIALSAHNNIDNDLDEFKSQPDNTYVNDKLYAYIQPGIERESRRECAKFLRDYTDSSTLEKKDYLRRHASRRFILFLQEIIINEKLRRLLGKFSVEDKYRCGYFFKKLMTPNLPLDQIRRLVACTKVINVIDALAPAVIAEWCPSFSH
jgi:hypothetical protein